MIEALKMMTAPIQVVGGVGAATISITDIKQTLTALADFIWYLDDKFFNNGVIDAIGDFFDKIRGFLGQIFDNTLGRIPLIGTTLEALYNIVAGLLGQAAENVSQAGDFLAQVVDLVIEKIGGSVNAMKIQGLLNQQPLLGITSLAGRLDGVLNIYGDQDVLVKLGISGKMDQIAGVSGDSILNIEIKSLTDGEGKLLAEADHYIYMRGIRNYSEIEDPVQRAIQQEYDLAISNFVATLLVEGKTMTDVTTFLFNDDRVRFNAQTNTFEVYPLGVQ
jgi:hypothetical protein